MSEINKPDSDQEVETTNTFNYLCDAAREIILRSDQQKIDEKDGEELFFREWYDRAEQRDYELSSKNRYSADPKFIIKSRKRNPVLPNMGARSYAFSKQKGLTFESAAGTQIADHRERHKAILDNILSQVIPLLPQLSEVLPDSSDNTAMRNKFDRIASHLVMDHLYTLRHNVRPQQYIDQLSAGIDDPILFNETREFLRLEMKSIAMDSIPLGLSPELFDDTVNKIAAGDTLDAID